MTERQREVATYGVVATLALFFLGDLLFSSSRYVSSEGLDLFSYYLPIRVLALEELVRGNIALWNPYILGGVPLLGSWQTAIFYPPGWLHMILPPALAVNWTCALHLALAGVFTCAWCRFNGSSRAASVVGGAIYMLCAPATLHVFAGHMSYVSALPWPPLLLLSVDGLVRNGRPLWGWVGAAAIALPALGGHPQLACYAALVAGLYLLGQLRGSSRPRRALLLFGALGVVAGLLAAAQAISGVAGAEEAWRQLDVSREFAGSFSLPPENLLTLFVPFLFGDNAAVPYFGGEFLWEACTFLGLASLLLAVMGAVRGGSRSVRVAAVLAVLCLVLALGQYTPLFELIYRIPPFDRMRALSRFDLLMALFVARLAATGFDELRKLERPQTWAVPALGVSITAAVSAVTVSASARDGVEGFWGAVMRALYSARKIRLEPELLQSPEFIEQAASAASTHLWICAAMAGVIGVLTALAGSRPSARCALGAVAVLELVAFGAHIRTTTTYPPDYPLADLRDMPPDARVLDPRYNYANQAILVRARQVGGLDPFMVERYAKLMQQALGYSTEHAVSGLQLYDIPRKLMYILGVSTVVHPDQEHVIRLGSGMPRVHLVTQYEVIPDLPGAVARLLAPEFNPLQSVILDAHPQSRPAPSSQPGAAEITAEGTDFLEVRARTTSPALLVLSETYSKFWHVSSLTASAQESYSVQPANHAFRAVALEAGEHHLRLEYVPPHYVLGLWLSGMGLVIWSAWGVFAWQRSQRQGATQL